VLIIRRSKLYYTASGIVTHCGSAKHKKKVYAVLTDSKLLFTDASLIGVLFYYLFIEIRVSESIT